METARKLGLEEGDLEQVVDDGRDLIGESFAIHRSRLPIEAQVITVPESDHEGAVTWGPAFSLDPMFYDSPEKQQLLGRNDFFQTFEMHFRPDGFTLCHPVEDAGTDASVDT
jgi:hypothetical protein